MIMTSDSAPSPRFDRAQILKAAGSMGVLGGNAHSAPRVMAALCNPVVSASQVAALIAKEPALYARVLRVANSAYYGQARSISTVESAVLLLGLDAVRGIAAAACLDRTAASTAGTALIDMRALVQHSLATAAAADALARIGHATLAADAFIAGLLHNLGTTVQIQLDTAGVQAIIRLREAADMRELRILEKERVAVGHEDCAAVIFESWQLPEALIAAARHHHDPMSAPESFRPLAALVNLGANLGLATGNTHTLEPQPAPRLAPAMDYLGLSDENLDAVAAELPERVAALRQAIMG